jgi:hypothetical protein
MNKPPLKLLDQVLEQIRLKHYSIRTEETYVSWCRLPEKIGSSRENIFRIG